MTLILVDVVLLVGTISVAIVFRRERR
jgi:hypothetical protein